MRSDIADSVPSDSERPAVAQQQVAENRESTPFPVVGIGASAGGLEAFRHLLSHLPEQTGMAFVMIQHLDPAHESQLADLLSKATRLPVNEATDGMKISPDHVYIIPPNVFMAMDDLSLRLTPRGQSQSPHLPVDFFFRSLAKTCQSRAIGVVLSGTGSDGSLGLAEIKAAGGITFAQDEDSAAYSSMPQSAVAGGCVDFVLPPDQIALELARIGQHPYLRGTGPSQREDEAKDEFVKILARLRAATGIDFSEYRKTTITRRIARRMALHKRESVPDYMRFLESNPSEIEDLCRDMLINVTSFFRDPEVFEALKSTVFPEIIKGKSPANPVRIWVPGCSTGQETYSLAMALLEFLDQQPAPPAIQLFGTDINDDAVEKARPGIYPPSIEAEVSPGRLRRFFTKVDGGYRIGKAIRDLCIFARQDLTADPPFSRLDLISCRNLLIYLSPPLQERIIPTLHYALNAGGFLLLGGSETVGKFSDLFEQVDRTHNIYSGTATLTYSYPYLVGRSYAHASHASVSTPAERLPALAELRKEADRVILGRFAPAAVLIDENLEILHFRGQTAPYLQPPSGPPTHNILKMARDSLFVELRGVIDEARKHNAIARRENVRLQDAHTVRLVNLEVTPLRLHGAPQRCFLVLFTEIPAVVGTTTPGGAGAAPGTDVPTADARENAELRQELASVKEYLQAIIEQQNAANEELQSANEEVRSANEELQSTNEEMQTAKEELQSANEELRTVNDELQARNLEVGRVNDDLTNTLSSIKFPVLMLGPDLRIRRFTTAAGALLNLIPADLGRAFGNIQPIFDIPDLSATLLDVIATVTVKEQEIQDRSGRWYLLAMHPYRTADNRIDGVILVLRDIDDEKRTKEHLAQVSGAKDHFLAVLSHELRTPLTPVLATVAMLQQDKRFDADTREHLQVIRRNAELEARLIDDLLDVTRIAKSKVDLDKRPVELAEVIRRAVEVCRPDMEGRRLEFGVDMGDAAHSIILADPTRLQQVFWNLLRNAIKFTPSGGCVGIRCREDGAGHVLVEVKDSGAGIDPDVLPRLFNAFEQGGASTTRQFGGLGLGLRISLGLVTLHGGSIEASSPGKGRGATFRVTLPLHRIEETRGREADQDGKSLGSKAATPPVRPLRILLVEDHGDTARILKRLLTIDGHEVEVAGDIAKALEFADSRPFDMLISDLGLPDGSGMDLMRELRNRRSTVLGIALSGYGQEEDIRHTKEAGFAAHLTKPISAERLAEVIATVTGPSFTPPPPPTTQQRDTPVTKLDTRRTRPDRDHRVS